MICLGNIKKAFARLVRGTISEPSIEVEAREIPLDVKNHVCLPLSLSLFVSISTWNTRRAYVKRNNLLQVRNNDCEYGGHRRIQNSTICRASGIEFRICLI
ncbi:hypothetical protein TWF751_008249 [Orbilia oligospora]|nr:hypothetical protein TWF751_008249 [Orbilia oligospora]